MALEKFTKDVLANQEGNYIIKFGAPWCGPCRQLGPVLDSFVEDGYVAYEVNTDEDQDLTIEYGVRSLPTILVVKDKTVVNTVMGFKNKQELIELVGEK